MLKKRITTTIVSEEKIMDKLEYFCAYQERCIADVKKKLNQLNIDVAEQDKYLNYLKQNNFLSEKRFAERFTQGKLNIKNWGKQKIIYHLRQKNIETKYIESEINSIDENLYKETLFRLLAKKNNVLKETDVYKKRQKLIIYAQQKGFELDLILKTLDKII